MGKKHRQHARHTNLILPKNRLPKQTSPGSTTLTKISASSHERPRMLLLQSWCNHLPKQTSHDGNCRKKVPLLLLGHNLWHHVFPCPLSIWSRHTPRRICDSESTNRLNATNSWTMVPCPAATLMEIEPTKDVATLAIEDHLLGLGYYENIWPAKLHIKHRARRHGCHLTNLLGTRVQHPKSKCKK